jgi:hypothetical protein
MQLHHLHGASFTANSASTGCVTGLCACRIQQAAMMTASGLSHSRCSLREERCSTRSSWRATSWAGQQRVLLFSAVHCAAYVDVTARPPLVHTVADQTTERVDCWRSQQPQACGSALTLLLQACIAAVDSGVACAQPEQKLVDLAYQAALATSATHTYTWSAVQLLTKQPFTLLRCCILP